MKKGDKFKVIEKSAGFDVGTIVTFTRYEKYDHTMAWFTGTTKFNYVDEWPVTLTKIAPYVEGRTILVSSKETTPTTKALYGEEDMVNSPSHYNSGDIECIDAIEAALTPEEFVGYLKGNQLKYIWRMGKKGDAAQDLDKSMWYGRKLMETINEI